MSVIMVTRIRRVGPCLAMLQRRMLSSSAPSVGFIGLGNMGLPMCMNLVSSGHQVVAYDTNEQSMSEAVGTQPAESLESFRDCGLIFTMLPECETVDYVVGSLMGVLEGSCMLVDCSTVSPVTSRRWHGEAQSKGHRFIDAPVSGGVRGAQEATLTFMVGCDNPTTLETARPCLEVMGKRIVACGGPGTGSATKLCNNLALAAQMIGICEAMNLGESLGVEPQVLADVMNTSTAKSWSCEVNNPHPDVGAGNTPAAKGYEGGFGTQLMLKDLALAVTAGQDQGIALPQGTLSKELYRMAALRGLGKKDFGVMLKFLQGGDS